MVQLSLIRRLLSACQSWEQKFSNRKAMRLKYRLNIMFCRVKSWSIYPLAVCWGQLFASAVGRFCQRFVRERRDAAILARRVL
jgi:hypothetical protein